MEEACKEWHRLLPVLLPAGAPDARLAPGAYFSAGADSGAGASSAAAVLLSYTAYPYFSSSERALVMRSMHCLAAAAADAAPGAVFAVLLPQEGASEAGVAGAARGAIAAAFSREAAAATPQLLGAACDVLVTAVARHPSLLDALLFPCGLEQSLLDKVGQGRVQGQGGGNAALLPECQAPTLHGGRLMGALPGARIVPSPLPAAPRLPSTPAGEHEQQRGCRRGRVCSHSRRQGGGQGGTAAAQLPGRAVGAAAGARAAGTGAARGAGQAAAGGEGGVHGAVSAPWERVGLKWCFGMLGHACALCFARRGRGSALWVYSSSPGLLALACLSPIAGAVCVLAV